MFTGGVARTVSVGADVAAAEPPRCVAVTVTRSVLPTSAGLAMYVAAVAPSMSTQFAPLASHRRHW